MLRCIGRWLRLTTWSGSGTPAGAIGTAAAAGIAAATGTGSGAATAAAAGAAAGAASGSAMAVTWMMLAACTVFNVSEHVCESAQSHTSA